MSEIKQALKAMERLANVQMNISLEEWSELSGVIIATLSSAAVAERESEYWAVHSKTGMHIGLWPHKSDADEALRGYEGGTITALYLDPPPASELEAENARLRAERDVAVAAMVRNNERSEVAEARLAEAMKALGPFAEVAGEAWADGSGWTNAACQNDRICDWFGPSAFHAARRVREGGKVDG